MSPKERALAFGVECWQGTGGIERVKKGFLNEDAVGANSLSQCGNNPELQKRTTMNRGSLIEISEERQELAQPTSHLTLPTFLKWWTRLDSNQGPSTYKIDALTTELRVRGYFSKF